MDEKKIQRINELARKAKSPEGLTEEEVQERALLRREYIDSVKMSLVGHLDNVYLVDEKGNEEKLKKGFRRLFNLVGNCFPWLVGTVD